MSPASQAKAHPKIKFLQDRAAMLQAARSFFAERNVLEVDCPILSKQASIDTHIDLITATYQGTVRCYMHSSPEYGMKRLLADGMGDIYQLSHVFRDGEWSPKHNPEFTMAEWYRLGFSLEQMMEETAEFIRLFLGDLPCETISYREAVLKATGIDYFQASEEELWNYIEEQAIPAYPSALEEGKDALLNLILAAQVENKLGKGLLTILAYYPASQAALAKKRRHGDEQVAERFEIYYQGVELANGYHELTDAKEQRQRLEEANAARRDLNKPPLPLDENFLEALKKGLPDCCGVAVGFDRLMMLRHQESDIESILPWGWRNA